MISYGDLTLRNAGYVSPGLQEKIRRTRLLVAGCGLGSVAAETAARTGFERFVLVDGDRVEAHNLNRQVYVAADVGQAKVEALARRLEAVNPGLQAERHDGRLNAENVSELVAGADLVFDTIDFLDLPAVVALHDQAGAALRPVISAFSAGWGAVAGVFLPGGGTLRVVFGLPGSGPVVDASYPALFREGIERLAPRLPPEFVEVSREAIRGMADGRSCPAPQLAAGAGCAAGLMVTLAGRVLAGEAVTAAPDLILVDPARLAGQAGINPGLRLQA